MYEKKHNGDRLEVRGDVTVGQVEFFCEYTSISSDHMWTLDGECSPKKEVVGTQPPNPLAERKFEQKLLGDGLRINR